MVIWFCRSSAAIPKAGRRRSSQWCSAAASTARCTAGGRRAPRQAGPWPGRPKVPLTSADSRSPSAHVVPGSRAVPDHVAVHRAGGTRSARSTHQVLRRLVVNVELRPDLVGFGGANPGVDGESVLPSFMRPDMIAAGRVSVAETLMGACLMVGVSILVGQDARLVVPTQGGLRPAHREQGCPQAVERFGLTVAVLHLAA